MARPGKVSQINCRELQPSEDAVGGPPLARSLPHPRGTWVRPAPGAIPAPKTWRAFRIPSMREACLTRPQGTTPQVGLASDAGTRVPPRPLPPLPPPGAGRGGPPHRTPRARRRLTAGALEARGPPVAQRGAPARAGLALLRLRRVGDPRGPGPLLLVVRGGRRRGVRGSRRAVEGVPAAVRARLAEHVVRDVQALVARAGRLQQRRRPPARAPAALGHGPGRRPRARRPQHLPAARAGARARAAARRPPPAQPAAQRPPPRARPARRLGRCGPRARGRALGAREAGRAGGTPGCEPDRPPRRCASSVSRRHQPAPPGRPSPAPAAGGGPRLLAPCPRASGEAGPGPAGQ